MHQPTTPRRGPSPLRRGFTLIEVLVVVAITAVLLAVTISVGAAVVGGAKANATKDVIRVLDQIAGNYITQNDTNPSPVTHHPDDWDRFQRGQIDETAVRLVAVADARWRDEQVMLNSVGWFIQQAAEEGLGEGLSGLDTRFVAVYTPGVSAGGGDAGGGGTGPGLARVQHPALTTAFDAWGRPLRYVHPMFDGQIVQGERARGDAGRYVNVAEDRSGYLSGRERNVWLNEGFGDMQIRRNQIHPEEFALVPPEQRDSDGGICPSSRPYFYSAGPDGDPATIDDNVYSDKPRFEAPQF